MAARGTVMSEQHNRIVREDSTCRYDAAPVVMALSGGGGCFC